METSEIHHYKEEDLIQHFKKRKIIKGSKERRLAQVLEPVIDLISLLLMTLLLDLEDFKKIKL
jgi:hypothetical protein